MWKKIKNNRHYSDVHNLLVLAVIDIFIIFCNLEVLLGRVLKME